MKQVTFNAPLNEKADIFQRMNNNPPSWWDKLIGLNGVYVEIRKRNRIHVYYEGGRIAELRVDEGKMSTTCHPKYLGIAVSGEHPKYIDCSNQLDKDPSFILKKIEEEYSQKKKDSNPEDISETKIKGDLITKGNTLYIDSEFAHSFIYKNEKISIRFDLVEISDNRIRIVELKRIKDGRLRSSVDEKSEILEQMAHYKAFIKEFHDEILKYYKTLYKIKQSLGLPVPPCDLNCLQLDKNPHLLIKNTYQKSSKGRNDRVDAIKRILKGVSYEITPEYIKYVK